MESNETRSNPTPPPLQSPPQVPPVSSAGSPHPTAPPGPPILSKAVASMILGYLSILLCACLGFPSVLLGGTAIWLGIWVQKHYTGNTASEFANVGSWMGMIVGGIGVVLGLISSLMWLLGVAGPIIAEILK